MKKQLDTALRLSVLICIFLNYVFSDFPDEIDFTFDEISPHSGSDNESYNGYSLMKTLTLEGDALMDEVMVLRSLGHFNRERIPERVVHAKGTTVYGTFRVTNAEIAHYTKASVFNGLGKETRVAVRFSSAFSDLGSADTSLDELRGMAIKFYTDEGVYDQVCVNMPVFFINDPQYFAQLTHAAKRNPRSNLRDANNYWDFFSLHTETLNIVTFLYTDIGIPDGFRHMSSWSVNAFRLTNHLDRHSYAKFVWIPDQGVRNLNITEAIRIGGIDPDYARRDLFQKIENHNFPSWTLYMQVITAEDIEKHFNYNPFDATKVWCQKKFPLVEVGTLELTSNVKNAFAENEQIAMHPGNLVPGIDGSPDRMLKGRFFSYRDTQFYRLGANFHTIPVNREPQVILSERDGAIRTDGNFYDTVNYFPNSKLLDRPDLYGIADSPFAFSMDDIAYIMPDSLEQQYEHARESYRALTDEQKAILHHNLAFSLSDITKSAILNRMFKHLNAINPMYAEGVRQEMIMQGKSLLINSLT